MNFSLATIKTGVITTAGKTKIQITKHSPEILLGIGILTFVGTIAEACHATLKADEILDHHKKKLEDIEQAYEIAEKEDEEYEYDEEIYKLDRRNLTVKTGVNLLKAYAPTIALGALSLTCILVSRNIMQKRYLGAVAAYNGLSEVFKQYRQRVVEEQGTEMDRHYRYGTELSTETRKEVDEDGNKVKIKETQENIPSLANPGGEAVFFDSSNRYWDENPNFSMMFLRGKQNIANDILHSRGHIFLNEVYDMLGFPQTQIGAIVGWVDGIGDSYVDFGLYDPGSEQCRRFVNGQENTILLDFNHDGVIWDKI